LEKYPIKVFAGAAALCEVTAWDTVDIVLSALLGFAGLPPALCALKAGKPLALANKETLVAGGALVMAEAKRAGAAILPVDSEHSAVFQCLQGAGANKPARLILTASGGPFRTWPKERIDRAKPEDALRHPNWTMGPKITVDSASMMNKALEVIEARWLFDMSPERIEVAVHPQSVVHSMVEFEDGAVLAQMGVPDMRVPILYAMAYPDRMEAGAQRLRFDAAQTLTFEPPDPDRFPALRLGRAALAAGGAAPAILNAANEAAVAAFLAERIPFGAIPALVGAALDAVPAQGGTPTLDQVLEADARARQVVAARLSTAI
jgi:1-deoxy-D-xylulose-5-phosphate reductoisomerase